MFEIAVKTATVPFLSTVAGETDLTPGVLLDRVLEVGQPRVGGRRLGELLLLGELLRLRLGLLLDLLLRLRLAARPGLELLLLLVDLLVELLLLLVDLLELALVGLGRRAELDRRSAAGRSSPGRSPRSSGRRPGAPWCSWAARRCPRLRAGGRAPAARARAGCRRSRPASATGGGRRRAPSAPSRAAGGRRDGSCRAARAASGCARRARRAAPGSSVTAAVHRDHHGDRGGVAHGADEAGCPRRPASTSAITTVIAGEDDGAAGRGRGARDRLAQLHAVLAAGACGG